MNKKLKLGIIITIVALVIGLVSIKKGSKTNVTLVGIIHNTKNMNQVLLICDARTFKEADFVCNHIMNSEDDEVSNLCKLRLDVNMTKFTNKCMRYYKLVDRVRQSQNKVSEYLAKNRHDHLIYESRNPIHIENFDLVLNNCQDPTQRPSCLLETHSFFIDGWFRKKNVDYLFEEPTLAAFIKKHPQFETDISICKDYQIEEKCKVMSEFMKLHANATEHYLGRTHGKNVIVIMGQDFMNYVSCKNFNKNRYNCKDVIL
ncbi:hypothetical protein SHI21_14035 [Bacteriovorax sp. PP10]|uniref:Uncharacterized protein n=1 Tax=Bacteriovorax antarcticus TaxID=3088717 RepID=A0ABU5VW95_9BACT|nr:hypothetical protein [Bacteriovorax sp. PP10]MEA9357341.1 hypothetical protein [Bacteriovorax sp. PP10]